MCDPPKDGVWASPGQLNKHLDASRAGACLRLPSRGGTCGGVCAVPVGFGCAAAPALGFTGTPITPAARPLLASSSVSLRLPLSCALLRFARQGFKVPLTNPRLPGSKGRKRLQPRKGSQLVSLLRLRARVRGSGSRA